MRRSAPLIALLAALIPATAGAAPWASGALKPLPADGPIHTAQITTWVGVPAIVLAGPEGVKVYGVDGTLKARDTRAVSALVVEDLDTDGTPELLVCGDDGLSVLRPGNPIAEGDAEATGLAEPIALSDARCEQLVTLKGDLYASLVTLSGGDVQVWTPGGDGLVAAPFDGPANPKALFSVGGRFAVMGDGVVTGPEPAGLEVGEGLVSLGPDGSGWAQIYGGDAPRLVLADESEVPLPAAPTSIRRVPLAGSNDLIVTLGGSKVAVRLGDTPFDITELPVPLDVLGSGDLDADGCRDLVAAAADGSEATVVMGVCEGDAAADAPPSPATGDTPLAVPVDGQGQPKTPEAGSSAKAPPASDVGGTLELGAQWATVELMAGVPFERQLVDGVNQWTRFAQRGGPNGLTLTESGLLTMTPSPAQVGLWRVSVLITDGETERWSGVVLRVKPPPRDAEAEPSSEPLTSIAARKPSEPTDEEIVLEAEEASVNDLRKGPGFFAIRECLVSAGVAGGISRNAQSSWSNVGLPEAVPSASPAVTMVCAGGAEKVRWFAGADSAPTFFYLTSGGRQNHVLAGSLGVEWAPGAFRVGPYVNAGLVVFGVGLRTVVVPFTTKKGGKHGLEARFVGYPANLAGQAMLGYTWEFGEF